MQQNFSTFDGACDTGISLCKSNIKFYYYIYLYLVICTENFIARSECLIRQSLAEMKDSKVQVGNSGIDGQKNQIHSGVSMEQKQVDNVLLKFNYGAQT